MHTADCVLGGELSIHHFWLRSDQRGCAINVSIRLLDQRMRKALEDNLQTSRDRLSNLNRARDNFDLVKLEIDRLENKIRSLSELAVNRQEPDYISGQVDQVAASMMQTEKTMNDLRFVTGLETVDEAPSLLQNEIPQPAKSEQFT